jgi:hypothetical protein
LTSKSALYYTPLVDGMDRSALTKESTMSNLSDLSNKRPELEEVYAILATCEVALNPREQAHAACQQLARILWPGLFAAEVGDVRFAGSYDYCGRWSEVWTK